MHKKLKERVDRLQPTTRRLLSKCEKFEKLKYRTTVNPNRKKE